MVPLVVKLCVGRGVGYGQKAQKCIFNSEPELLLTKTMKLFLFNGQTLYLILPLS